MKSNTIFNYIVTLVILPSWLNFVQDIIKKIPCLYYTIAFILTLLTVFYLVLTIRELSIKLDSHFNFQRRRMDWLIRRTRKKLQRIIARTSDASIMDYALTKLREICAPEIYSGILNDMAEKEKKPVIKEILLLRAKQSGGRK